MTREEAIKALQYERKTALHENKGAFDMAIEALSTSEIPNKCEDAISRQAVMDAMYDLCGEESLKDNPWRDNPHIDSITDAIEHLPSVTPKQKMGRWIPVRDGLPEDRDWNLAVFREKDTGYQCIPRVASYVGHDMWIVIDADSVDRGWFSDLECIAWMPLPEPYKAEKGEE